MDHSRDICNECWNAVLDQAHTAMETILASSAAGSESASKLEDAIDQAYHLSWIAGLTDARKTRRILARTVQDLRAVGKR